MSTPVLVGLSIAAVGYTGRYLARYGHVLTNILAKSRGIVSEKLSVKYYHGGFDAKMSRREAALILGVSQTISKTRLRDAYKRLILVNHPDRGGSPYLAAKINEAKTLIERGLK